MSELAGEIYGIRHFSPSGTNLELLNQINDSLRQVNLARDAGPNGLPAEIVQKIDADFRVDFVRNSATIEGSTLDRRETLLVLTTGQIIAGKPRSSLETKNLGNALTLVSNLIAEDSPVDLKGLLSLHRVLMDRLIDQAGRVRTRRVMLTGAKFQPPNDAKIPELLANLLEDLSQPGVHVHPFTAGVYAHWAMARIHPFEDGNGRMARILQDWLFLKNRLVGVPITFGQADEYYSALQEADDGRPEIFFTFVALSALKCLARYQAALDSKREPDDWIEDLAAIAAKKTEDREMALYLKWSQRVDELRNTFSSIVEKLQLRLPMIKITMREYGTLGIDKFRRLVNQGKASLTWDFGVEFQDDIRSCKFMFWHGVHWKQSGDPEFDRVPALILSSLQDDKYRMLKDIQDEKLTLREVAFKDGEFVRIRYDATEAKLQFDGAISSQTICREFFQDVLRTHFGIG